MATDLIPTGQLRAGLYALRFLLLSSAVGCSHHRYSCQEDLAQRIVPPPTVEIPAELLPPKKTGQDASGAIQPVREKTKPANEVDSGNAGLQVSSAKGSGPICEPAQALSLPDAIATAFRQQPRLRVYLESVEQARRGEDIAFAPFLPMAVAGYSVGGFDLNVGGRRDGLKLTTDDVNESINEAKAAVELAKANLTLAKQEFDRFTKLASQEATTTRRAQEVTRAHDASGAELRLADAKRAKADSARTRIEVANRDLEVARTVVAKAAKTLDLAETGYDQIREVELMVGVKKEMVKDAQIALESAEHQFQFTQIRAPFPGVVVKRYRHLGDFTSAGVAILSMYNPDLTYVTANLEETRLRGVAPGNAVELDVDAFAEPFHGRVVWIDKSTGAQFALMPRNVVSGEFTKVVQRVPVRIQIEKDERWPLLRSGLSVRAAISHGAGDQQWAEQAARAMKDLEARYNQPQRPDREVHPGKQP